MHARCPRCGAAFDCGVDRPATDPCWCAEVPLDPSTRDGLAAAFTSCLCPTCLTAAASAAAGGPSTVVALRPRPLEEDG